MIIVSIVLLIVPFKGLPIPPLFRVIFAGMFLVAAGLLLVYRKKTFNYLFCILLALSVATSLTTLIALRYISSSKSMATLINTYRTPTTKIIEYYAFDRDLPFYLQSPILLVEDWDDKKLLQKDSWRGVFSYEAQYHVYPQLLLEKKCLDPME